MCDPSREGVDKHPFPLDVAQEMIHASLAIYWGHLQVKGRPVTGAHPGVGDDSREIHPCNFLPTSQAQSPLLHNCYCAYSFRGRPYEACTIRSFLSHVSFVSFLPLSSRKCFSWIEMVIEYQMTDISIASNMYHFFVVKHPKSFLPASLRNTI